MGNCHRNWLYATLILPVFLVSCSDPEKEANGIFVAASEMVRQASSSSDDLVAHEKLKNADANLDLLIKKLSANECRSQNCVRRWLRRFKS